MTETEKIISKTEYPQSFLNKATLHVLYVKKENHDEAIDFMKPWTIKYFGSYQEITCSKIII